MRNVLGLLLLPALLAACSGSGTPDDERVRMASAAMASGNSTAATEIAAEMARANPRDAQAQLRHAELLAATGRWPEAADAFARAVIADGTLRAAHLGLGRARLRGSDLHGAERAFREAIAALPGEAGAQSGLGVALDMQGRHAEAQEAYRAALSIDSAHAGARTNLALSLTLSGQGTEAVRVLEPVVRAPGSTPRQRHNLALAYAVTGDAPRAAALLAPELGETSREAAMAWRTALEGS